jgi:hypothetical protein
MSRQENYHGELNEEGIASTRVEDLADAMDKLHSALCKCDYSNRRKFFEKDIITRLKEYGKATGMADVTDMGRKSTNCYVPVKKEGDYLIGLKIKDTPGTQLMCQEKAHDGTPVAMSFSDLQEAAKYCMERNIEMGLKADDVTAIVKSSDVAKDLQLEAQRLLKKNVVPFAATEAIEELLRKYAPFAQITADTEGESALLPEIQRARAVLKESVSVPVVKDELPSKQVLLLEDVTSALIDAKIASGLSEDEANSIPVVAKVETFRREYYGLDKVLPHVVTIQKDQNGEFRVPGPAGKEEAGACYTDDKQDAVGTAKAMYGADVVCKFKTVEQHISKEDGKPAVEVPVKSGRSRR